MSNLAPFITLAVSGVVAVGTLLWYLFSENKEKPLKQNRGGGGRFGDNPSSFPDYVEYPRAHTTSSKAIKRKSSESQSNKKSVADSNTVRSSYSTVNTECNTKSAAGSKPDAWNSSNTNPALSKQDSSLGSSPDSSVGDQPPLIVGSLESPHELNENSCKVSDQQLGITKFQPCGHNPFCDEHARFYLDNAEENEIKPKCTELQCNKKSVASSNTVQSSYSTVNTECNTKSAAGSKPDAWNSSNTNPALSKQDSSLGSSPDSSVGDQPPLIVGSLESPHELNKNSCKVSDQQLGITKFQPCGHNPSCDEHALYYLDNAEENEIKPKCTELQCNKKSVASSNTVQSSYLAVNTECNTKSAAGSKPDAWNSSNTNPALSKQDASLGSSPDCSVGDQPPLIVGSLESSHELTENSCNVCDQQLGITKFQPCGHNPFCDEHARFYLDNGEENEIKPRCPALQCHQRIENLL